MSSMAFDQLAALTGGGQPQQQDPSAQLAAALGLDQGQGQPDPQQDAAPDDPGAILDEILRLMRAFKASESDPEFRLRMEKASTEVAGIQADEQKMSDGMMSGKTSPRAMRRASGAGGY